MANNYAYPYPYPYPYGVGRGLGRVRAVLRVINRLLEVKDLNKKDKEKLQDLKKAITDKDYLPTVDDLNYVNKLAKEYKVGVPYLYPLGQGYYYPYPYTKKQEFSELQSQCKFKDECPIKEFVSDEIPEEAFLCEYSIEYGCPLFFKEARETKKVGFKIDIFRTGTWHGKKYTEEDLKQIVENFKKYNDKSSSDFEFVPRIKLTHKESGELSPAFGWVKNLWVEKDRLMAEIVDIPEKVYNIIKDNFFDRSIELYTNYKTSKGERVGYVLRAVAFLGADVPEVKGMEPLEQAETFVYNENQDFITIVFKEGNMLEKILEKLDELKFSEEQKKLLENLKAELQEKEKKFSEELEKHKELLKEKDEQIKTLASAVKDKTEELLTKEAEVFTEKAIANGNLLPKQREMVIELIKAIGEVQPIKFNEKEIKPVELFKQFIESIKQIDYEEKSKDTEEKPTMDELVKKYQEEGMTLEDAIIKASKELNVG